ncbi:ORF43 [Ictalurid herpesvirus 1]|uniref:Uncharacterized protein ORF43 n=1 Tax=Ictalurid herpesvirus 1 (strain Auburn) TaxID=766178 RepID=VG43_ICHVA|nr:ORF43 [Ictalurid herpesvirus 1]Q00161.1 RecName: Full=Uncharacterized protein ORF43 [Ictalurid herpesvirus 1 (strain Auburn)]AAA88146.1 ORF43 [Ictalurid herpesvirus 1]
MDALRKNIGMDLIGGAHDMDRFDSLHETAAFLPIIQGPENKMICAFINPETKGILKVYPEHLGFFLEKIGTEAELRAMVGIATAVMDSVDSEVVYTPDDSVAVSQLPTPELLVEARRLLDVLAASVEKKRVKIGGGSTGVSYAVVLARLETRVSWVPHNAFLELAQLYTTVYRNFYGLGDFLALVATSLHLDNIWPLAVTRKITTPLFVDTVKQEEVEMEVNGEQMVLSQKYVTFKAFKGFVLETDSEGGLSESDAADDPFLAESITLKLEKNQMTKMMDRDLMLKTAILSIRDENPRIKRAKNNIKLVDEFFMGIDRMAQPAFVKLAKKLMGSAHMVAILQSTLRSSILSWGLNDVAGTNTTMSDPELLNKLRRQTYVRMLADLSLLKVSRTPMGMFSVKDVSVKLDDRYWQGKKDATADQDKILQFYNQQGPTTFIEWLNKIGIESLEIPEKREPGKVFPVNCLWSVYNSTEFTEFGTLTVNSTGKGATQSGTKHNSCSDLSDLGKFRYVVRATPGTPPASILGLMHLIRTALFGVVCVSIHMAGEFFAEENLDLELNSNNKAATTVMRKMGDQFFRGYFFNLGNDDKKVKSSFDMIFRVFGAKGRALLSRKDGNGPNLRRSNAFNGLEWLRKKVKARPELANNMRRAIRNLLERYDVQAMILDQAETRSLYYLRPMFMTPFKTELQASTIISKKADFNNAPTLLHVNLTSVTISPTNTHFTLPLAPIFNKWDQHKVYGIILEMNTNVYSQATRGTWTATGGGQFFGADVGIDSLMSSLLSQVSEDEPVTSELINMFSLDKVRYDTVVERLKALSRYEETEPPVYGEDLVLSRELEQSDELDCGTENNEPLVLQPFEKDCSRKRAATTLSELWAGPSTKISRIEGDDED